MAGRARNTSFPKWLHDAIADRAKAAGESFPRTIERLWEESQGNLQQLRHDSMQPLSAIRLNVAMLRKLMEHVSGSAATMTAMREVSNEIEAGVNEFALRLAKPAAKMVNPLMLSGSTKKD